MRHGWVDRYLETSGVELEIYGRNEGAVSEREAGQDPAVESHAQSSSLCALTYGVRSLLTAIRYSSAYSHTGKRSTFRTWHVYKRIP